MVMIPYSSTPGNLSGYMWGTTSGATTQISGREGELYEELRQAEATGKTKVFTADDAGILGIDMSGDVDDWGNYNVKFTPDSSSDTGFAVSVISPDNYEFTQTGNIITPQGQSYTSSQWDAYVQTQTQQVQSYTTTAAGIGSTAGFVQLANGEYVSEYDFYSYQPAYREKLKSLGVAGFNQYMQGINQGIYDELVAQQLTAYNQQMTGAGYVQLPNGEWLDAANYATYAAMPANFQQVLNQVGVDEFNDLMRGYNAMNQTNYAGIEASAVGAGQVAGAVMGGTGHQQYNELIGVTGSNLEAIKQLPEYLYTDLSPAQVHAYLEGVTIPEGVSEVQLFNYFQGVEAALQLERLDTLLAAVGGMYPGRTPDVIQETLTQRLLPYYQELYDTNPEQFVREMGMEGRDSFTEALVDYMFPAMSDEYKGLIFGEVPESGMDFPITMTDGTTLPAQLRSDNGVYAVLNPDEGEVKLGTYDLVHDKFVASLDALVEPKGLRLADGTLYQEDTRNFWQKLGGSIEAGWGDYFAQGAGVAKWLGGKMGIDESGQEYLSALLTGGPGSVLAEYRSRQTGDPGTWEMQERMQGARVEGIGWSAVETSVSMLPLIAISAATGGAGAAAGGTAGGWLTTTASGLGKYGARVLLALAEASPTIGATIAGGTTSRIMESLVEAGGAYDEAIQQGMSAEEADNIADTVFNRNVTNLSASDYAQFALAWGPGKLLGRFTPAALSNLANRGIIRVVMKAGQYGGIALTEAGEEYYQEIIKRQAFGEDVSGAITDIYGNLLNDEELRQVAILGGLLGVAMGGAVDIVQSGVTIREATVANIPENMRPDFLKAKADAVRQGAPIQEATTAALDAIASTPEGQTVIQNVTNAAVMQGRVSEMVAKSDIEAQELVDRATATTKPVEGITYTVQNSSQIPATWEDLRGGSYEQENAVLQEARTARWAAEGEVADVGVQNDMFGGTATATYVRGKGEWIQAGMDDLLKYEQQTGKLRKREQEAIDAQKAADTEFAEGRAILEGQGMTPDEVMDEMYAEAKKMETELIARGTAYHGGTRGTYSETTIELRAKVAQYKMHLDRMLNEQYGIEGGTAMLQPTTPLQRVGTIYKGERPTATKPSDLARVGTIYKGTKPVQTEAGATGATAEAENAPPAPSGEVEGGEGAPPQPPAIPAHEEQPPGGQMPKALEARDSVISISKAMIEANGTNAITRAVAKTPGVGNVVRFIKAKIDLDPKVHLAMVSQVRAQAYVQHTLFTGEANTEKALISAFGKDAVYKGAVAHDAKGNPAEYIGPSEEYCPGLKGTIKDIADNPERYSLTPKQQKAIDMMREHGDYGLDIVNQGFIKDKKNKIHRYPPKQNGAFLSTVDVGTDVVEHIGSETRAVTAGRGKTRVYPSAQERWTHAQKAGQAFTPETNVALLLRGQDAFKARMAGNEVYRQTVGGKTREQVLQETHPDLYAKMQALKKRLTKLQGYKNILTREQGEAIDIFLESDHESEDFDALEQGIAPTLEAGRYVAKAQAGKDITVLNREIGKVKKDITDLRPAWTSANPKPYVMVKEGMFRYFDAKVANDVTESLKVSNNFLVDMLDQTRRIAFGLDGSPITIQGQIAALFDPISMVRITGKQFVQTVRHKSPFYTFSQEYIKDTIAAHPREAAEFAMLEGIPLGNTFDEFTLGWAEKMPVVGKGVKVINDSLFTWLRVCKFNMWMANSSHLTKVGYDPMVAKVSAHAVMNGVYPMADRTLEGQSQARAKDLRALPTSYSFLMEPAKLMGEAVQGYAKIATRQQLTARERLSVEMMTRMAATTAFASVLSAALSGLATGKDWDEIGRDMLDAINPSPDNGRFLSIVIGDYRFPLGGPYRALFRAIYPNEVEGVPFPVPFAGLYNFFKNRLNPFLGTQIDLIRNKDYSNRTILEGGWPAKFLQFLEYELEGTVPLSLSGVLEDIRIDRKNRIIQDLISGLMGVNTINMDDTYANRMWNQMGQVDAEGNVYDVGDFWGDIKPYYGDSNYNRQEPYTQSVMDGMKAYDEMGTYRNKTLFEMRDDYEKVYEDGGLADWEYELLQQFDALLTDDERDAFRKEHPEMDGNPQKDWLVANPHANALLALWGQAKIYSLEAYTEMMDMAKGLDIAPEVMDFGLPGMGGNLAGDTSPEMMAAWFEYQGKADEFHVEGEGTPPEAKLYRLENPYFNAWMETHNQGTVKESIEILKAITDPAYKVMDKAYDGLVGDWERTAYLIEHPDYARTLYELKAYGKDNPYPAEWADDYAGYRIAVDLNGANKYQWMIDHPEFYKVAYEIDSEVRDWGANPNLEYLALPNEEQRTAYRIAHPDFAQAWWTEQAVRDTCPMTADYVAYQMLRDKDANAEAKIYRLDHPDFEEWLQTNANPPEIDETRQELEIGVKWADQDNAYDALNTTEKQNAYLIANPEYATARYTREALHIGCPLIDDYVAYESLITQWGGSSTDPAAQLYRLSHPEFNAWLDDNTNIGPVDESVEELDISVKWRQQDIEYAALNTTDKQSAYLLANPEYATARFTRDAYAHDCPLVDDYVAYYTIASQWGSTSDPEAKLYRLEHPEFDAWLTTETNTDPIDDNVNALQIQVDYRQQFTEYGALANAGQRDAYLKSHVEFTLAYYSMAAYNKGYADQWVDDYADYYYHVNLMGESRNWYLKQHQSFFYYAQGIEGWADIDFSKVNAPGSTGSGGSGSGGGYTADSKDYAKYAAQIGVAQKWVAAYVAYRKALDEGYSRKEYFFKHQDLYRYLLSMGLISEYEFTQGASVIVAGVPLRVTKD